MRCESYSVLWPDKQTGRKSGCSGNSSSDSIRSATSATVPVNTIIDRSEVAVNRERRLAAALHDQPRRANITEQPQRWRRCYSIGSRRIVVVVVLLTAPSGTQQKKRTTKKEQELAESKHINNSLTKSQTITSSGN